MKVCPFCSKEIPDEAAICPHCGRDLVAAAEEAAGQLRAAGYPFIKSVLWIGGYILLTSIVRGSILYFTVRTGWPAHWSMILSGVAALAILGYGVFRAQQQKRSAIKWLLLVYAGYTAFMTWIGTSAVLSD